MKSKLAIIGVGYEKAGTTSAHDILKSSKKISAPCVKETFFFNQHYESGAKYYSSLYKSNKHAKFHLDITPSYHRRGMKIFKRINDFFEKKIIILFLRDPIHRAFSHYWHDIFYHKIEEFPTLDIEDFDSYTNDYNKYFLNLNKTLTDINHSFKKEEVLICYLEDVHSGNFINLLENKIGESLEIRFKEKQSNKKKIPSFSIDSGKLRIFRENHPVKIPPVDINKNFKDIIGGLVKFAAFKRSISLSEYKKIKERLYSNIRFEEFDIEPQKLFANKKISI